MTKLSDKEFNELDAEFGKKMSDEEFASLAEEFESPIQAKPADKTSESETALRAAAQTVTLEHADEITGAIESAFTDKSYEQARDESRAAFKEAAEDNPSVHTASTIGTAAAVGFIPAVGQAMTGLRGAMVIGGLTGVGLSEEKTIPDIALDGVIGATVGAVADKVVVGGSQLVKKMAAKSSNAMKRIIAEQSKQILPSSKRFNEITHGEALLGKFKTFDEYASSDAGKRRGELLPKKIIKDAATIIKNEMDILGEALASRKLELGVDLSINHKPILDGFKARVKQLDEIGMPAKAKVALENLIEDIDTGKMLSGKPIDISALDIEQAHSLKSRINDIRFTKDESGFEVFKKAKEANIALTQFGDDLINSFNKLDKSGKLEAINKRFTGLYELQSMSPTKERHVAGLLKRGGTSKADINGRDFLMTADKIDPVLAENLYNQLNPDLKLLSYIKMSEQIKMGAGPLFQISAGAGLGAAAGFGVGGEQGATVGGLLGGVASVQPGARKVLIGTISKAVRDAFKIPRNLTGILENSDIIQSKIAAVSLPAAIEFNRLVHEGRAEEIEEFMVGIQNDPRSQEEFEPGLGFEGKIATPQEAEHLRNQVSTSGKSPSGQLELINQINQGQIPDFDSVPNIQFIKKRIRSRRDRNRKKVLE